MQKSLAIVLSAALTLAAATAAAAPREMNNPRRTVNKCHSLAAPESDSCKRAEDYCTRKPKDRSCLRYNTIKKSHPFEQKPASEPEPMEIIHG